MRPNSLAFRLSASSAAWSVVVLFVAGLILASLFRNSVEQSFDARLEDSLSALLASIEYADNGTLTETSPIGDPRFDRPFQGWYWQVQSVDRPEAPKLSSVASLLERELEIPAEILAAGTTGEPARFYMTGPFGLSLRAVQQVFTLPGSPELLSFTVTGNADALDAEIATFNQTLAWTLSVLAIGLVAAVLIQVRFGLAPLRDLKQELSAVRIGRSQRLTGDYPDEILPVATELNALLKSNADVVDRARTQVGNLAHALKTPLSVITNEAEASETALASKVREQSDIMRDQVSLYLDRARRAARAHTLGSLTEVAPVLDGLVRALERINKDRGIHVIQNYDRDLRFLGERQDLEEMIGNLLDNAFKWAVDEVHVSMKPVAQQGGTTPRQYRLIVEDDGPGLPAGQRDRAMKRGQRLDETKPGSGLGLSIVSETASMYDGSLALSDAHIGGLRVELTLPITKSATPE